MGVKRAVGGGGLVVGVFCVEEAEAVVVLGGEDIILKAVPRGNVGPDLGAEAGGIEALVEIAVLVLEGLGVLFPVDLVPAPFGVSVGQGPGLADPEFGIDAEMHHQREFLVFEPLQLFEHGGIRGTDVLVLAAASVHSLDDCVCHDFLLIGIGFGGYDPLTVSSSRDCMIPLTSASCFFMFTGYSSRVVKQWRESASATVFPVFLSRIS